MANVPYRMATPRRVVTYTYDARCYIDPALVKPWEAYSEAEQAEFDDHGSIPCEGGFTPGIWCEECRFGDRTTDEAAEDD